MKNGEEEYTPLKTSTEEKTMERFSARYQRNQDVCHPVRIHITDPDWARYGLPKVYNGFMKNLSMGGMRAYMSEGYNPLDVDNLLGKRITVELSIPSSNERLDLDGKILWGMREGLGKKSLVVGIHFIDISPADLNSLQQLLSVGNRDHNMLWDLWDNLRMNE